MRQTPLVPHKDLPSNNKFGTVFTAIFFAAMAYFFLEGHIKSAIAIAPLAIFFLFATATSSKLLTLPNYLWYSFGVTVGKLFSPITLAIIFFLLITPLAIVMKLLGRDELRLKNRFVASYWVDRNPVGPSGDSFKNQY
jgi:hypothetical protein